MNDIKPIASAGVIACPVGPTKPCAQCQTTNAAHAIDANLHALSLLRI
jgi:hypothetical protein